MDVDKKKKDRSAMKDVFLRIGLQTATRCRRKNQRAHKFTSVWRALIPRVGAMARCLYCRKLARACECVCDKGEKRAECKCDKFVTASARAFFYVADDEELRAPWRSYARSCLGEDALTEAMVARQRDLHKQEMAKHKYAPTILRELCVLCAMDTTSGCAGFCNACRNAKHVLIGLGSATPPDSIDAES